MDKVLFNIHDVVLLLTIVICLLLTSVLWISRSGARHYNIFLVLFFLAGACIPLDTLINYGAAVRPWVIANLPNMFYVFEGGAWIQASLAYWLLRALLEKEFKLVKTDLLLVLPFVLNVSHQVVAYHSLPIDVKVALQKTLTITDESITVFFVQCIRDIFRSCLAWVCFCMVNNYLQCIHHRLSPGLTGDYGWLRFFAMGFLALNLWSLLISMLLFIHVEFAINLPIGLLGLVQNYFTCLFYMMLIVLYTRYGIRVDDIKPAQLNARKNTLNYAVYPEYVSCLEPLMVDDKVYTNPELTLDLLARKIGISPRTLSSVINGHYGCNFFEYINQYRVQEAKRLLSSREFYNTTELDIMYEAGFNSKATFNGFFKKMEGMTPSQYRKQHVEL